jgi:DNA end-binding protein Ku
MEDEDFDKVPVSTTHAVEITDFVPLEQIDPIYFQKTYYLEPESIGAKPFALLREVLKDSRLVALAKVTLRQKEQLATLRVYGDTIAMETCSPRRSAARPNSTPARGHRREELAMA